MVAADQAFAGTIGHTRRKLIRALEASGATDPVHEATWILEAVLGLSAVDQILQAQSPLPQTAHRDIEALLAQRCMRIPLATLLGHVWFAGYRFHLDPGVLVPRPDSELLLETALDRVGHLLAETPGLGSSQQPLLLLDTCTGSGCIGLSLARRLLDQQRQFQLTLVDIDPRALACARKNVRAFNLQALVRTEEADCFPAKQQTPFHLILANPPYIPDAHLADLMPEVQHEPRQALAGGADGLTYLRRLAQGAGDRLHTGGWLLLEHGYDQAPAVSAILKQAGWADRFTVRDLGGQPRVTGGRKPRQEG